MRKTTEKVALIAFISISAIFVLLTVLMMLNFIPLNIVEGVLVIDGFMFTIMLVLVVIYILLGAYLIYSAFSQHNIVREVLLYSDATNNTNATSTVIRRIATNNAKLVKGVKIKKLRIIAMPNGKLSMKLTVNISGNEVAYSVDTLRCLLVDSYQQILALKFDSIDFSINKINTTKIGDIDKATRQATVLRSGRHITEEIFQQPIVEQGAIIDEVVSPIVDEAPNGVTHATEHVQQSTIEQDNSTSQEIYGTPHRPLEEDMTVEIVDDDTLPTDADSAIDSTHTHLAEDEVPDHVAEGILADQPKDSTPVEDIKVDIADEPTPKQTVKKSTKAKKKK